MHFRMDMGTSALFFLFLVRTLATAKGEMQIRRETSDRGNPHPATISSMVIAHQRPRRQLRFRLSNQIPEIDKESFTVGVVAEDLSPFYPPCYDMVKSAGSIDSGAARHEGIQSLVGQYG
jgi:hypothetical protein